MLHSLGPYKDYTATRLHVAWPKHCYRRVIMILGWCFSSCLCIDRGGETSTYGEDNRPVKDKARPQITHCLNYTGGNSVGRGGTLARLDLELIAKAESLREVSLGMGAV